MFHEVNGLPNQDRVFYSENADAVFLAVADGVTACKNSGKGAQIACESAAKIMLEEVDYIFRSDEEKIAYILLSYIQDKILQEDENGQSYASTLSFVCINKKTGKVMTFELGDSCIFLIRHSDMVPVKPIETAGDNYCCATMTEEADRQVTITFTDVKEIDSVLICTDGAWRTMVPDGRVVDTDLKKAVVEGNTDEIDQYFDGTELSDDCTLLLYRVER